MNRLKTLCAAAIAAGVLAGGAAVIGAESLPRTLVVTMTNDANANELQVYDAASQALIDRLPTHGKGGASGNARAIAQDGRDLVAVANNGSNTVALFARHGDQLAFAGAVTTTSAPVSIAFGNDHMYVAGATTVDSFVLRGRGAAWLDGTIDLELAGGGAPPAGSTAQVGVLDAHRLIVTLKTPDPGTVDVMSLQEGRVGAARPVAVGPPADSLTPFGFSTYPDGTALITLAGSNQDALFRGGAFVAATAPGPGAPCWATTVGKFVFVSNTGGRTISRLLGTGGHVFVDSETAAPITTGGGPADIDAANGILAVIDRGTGQSHLSLFTYDAFGELSVLGAPITIDVPGANGVAVLAPPTR